MKKVLFRTILAAAVICAATVTVFAATGGLEYIKSIYGESAESIQEHIITPYASASANDRDMAVEAVLSDGYVTNIVVSLTGLAPDVDSLFWVSGDIEMDTVSIYPIEELSTPGKTYYVVAFTNRKRFVSADITVSLNKDVAPIDLTFRVDNKLENAVIRFPKEAKSGPVHLKELQISPLGFLLVGTEDEAKGGLPSTAITLVYSDGLREEVEVEFDDGGGETVSGGGGAILVGSGQQAPLVVSFHGMRNPDGEIVITGQFSRVIDPKAVEKVIIMGREYDVQ